MVIMVDNNKIETVKYKRKILQDAGVHMIDKLSEIADMVSDIL